MRRALSLTTALVIAAASTYGCDKETPEDKLVNSLDEYQDVRNEQVEILCDCYEEFTYGGNQYASKSDCKEGLGEILPARRRCLDEAFKQDVSASQSYVDCALPLEAEYRDCLDSKLDCQDPASPAPCGSDYDLGKEDCIELPQSVQRDVDDCYK